mmetsp:Transcript_6386/g.39828  ORF Transcript_6386/g.39828 Transcript_6386/m.39828 type:complete len:142 (-) Transcript_6386:136-561(-)
MMVAQLSLFWSFLSSPLSSVLLTLFRQKRDRFCPSNSVVAVDRGCTRPNALAWSSMTMKIKGKPLNILAAAHLPVETKKVLNVPSQTYTLMKKKNELSLSTHSPTLTNIPCTWMLSNSHFFCCNDVVQGCPDASTLVIPDI